MRTFRCACQVAVLAAAALSLRAQTWDTLKSLKPGDHVKVQEDAGPEHSGQFRAVTAESITLATEKAEVAIEKAKVRRVKVRSGSRRVRNLLIGAGIGVAVGAAVDNTLGVYIRNESSESEGARVISYLVPIGVLGGIGAALPPYRTVYKAH